MGFMEGRMTFQRFRVKGRKPPLFDEAQLKVLAEYSVANARMMSGDGSVRGWSAGEHVLDEQFTQEKQVVADSLWWAYRIDTTPLPKDLMRAYYAIDLAALIKSNPSGRPSARQKREAKESSRDRIEQEAKDGRFIRRKLIEVLWDRSAEVLYYGATGLSQIDHLVLMLRRTFEIELESMTAGRLAEGHERAYLLDELRPSPLTPGTPEDYAWVPDEASRDWLGNEFLMWLWYQCEDESAEIVIDAKRVVTAFFSTSLKVQCPRGATGSDAFRNEGPAHMPEALSAIRHGKMPRVAGLIVAEGGRQFAFNLLAELMGVGGLKLPPQEDEPVGERAQLEYRVETLREFAGILDGLYQAFLTVRLSAEWADVVRRIQRWLEST